MTRIRFTLAWLLLAAAAQPVALPAQPTQFGYRVIIPGPHIPYSSLGEGKIEMLTLQWNVGTPTPVPGLTTGTPVTRTVRVNSSEEVSFSTTLSAPITTPASGPALAFPGHRATIYPDKADPSRLRVNFWLQPNGLQWQEAGQTVSISADSARKIHFYFKLKNRQSVRFSTQAWSVGALTLPLRIRPGYRASNGTVIPTTGGALAAGIYGGYTWGRARYTYLEHTETAVEQVWGLTVAGLLSASSADVDSTTTRSAATPVSQKTGIAVVSPGLGVLGRVRGVEVGAFVGIDYGIGRVARAWDYHGRYWFGAGLGFNLWKL